MLSAYQFLCIVNVCDTDNMEKGNLDECRRAQILPQLCRHHKQTAPWQLRTNITVFECLCYTTTLCGYGEKLQPGETAISCPRLSSASLSCDLHLSACVPVNSFPCWHLCHQLSCPSSAHAVSSYFSVSQVHADFHGSFYTLEA